MHAPGYVSILEASAWFISFSEVYCCCELGENNVSHCCLEELGLPDTFCQLGVVVECVCVVYFVFFSPQAVGHPLLIDKLYLGFLFPLATTAANIETSVNDGNKKSNNYANDQTVIVCMFFCFVLILREKEHP